MDAMRRLRWSGWFVSACACLLLLWSVASAGASASADDRTVHGLPSTASELRRRINDGAWASAAGPTVHGLRSTASGAITIRITPTTKEVAVGATFAVQVVADVGTELDPHGLGAYQFDLLYDPDDLQLIAISDAGSLAGSDRTLTTLGPISDTVAGRVAFGVYTVDNDAPQTPGPQGSVVLATVQLRALQATETSLALEDAAVTDVVGQEWPNPGAGSNVYAAGATVAVTEMVTVTPTATATHTPLPTATPTPAMTVDLPLASGWNLIALPLIPLDPAPATVLAAIAGNYSQVYAYRACDAQDPWKAFRPSTQPPLANDLTALDGTMGLWINSTVGASTLTITGVSPGATTVSLCPGWNLIGYPASNPVPLPAALASIAGRYDRVYAYDAGNAANPWQKFDPNAGAEDNDLTEMRAGVGYWISITAGEAVTLTVN